MNHDILLHAQSLATSATLLAKQQPRPVTTVDPIAVEKILARLPEKAGAGRLRDPDAERVLFAAWDPQDTAAHHLYGAVATELQASGLRVDVITENWGRYAVPRALFVDYESLDALAAKIRFDREDWLLGARAEWTARFGEAGAVEREGTAYGDIVVFIAPAMPDEDAAMWREPEMLVGARPMYRTGTGWYEQDFSAVAATALAELKVPVWTFEAVARAWQAIAPGGDVVRHRGLWTRDGMRPIPTLIFRRGDVERTVAVEDVYALSVAALVERVRTEGGAAWGELTEPGKATGHHKAAKGEKTSVGETRAR